jgi:hypothetical protein
MLKLASGLAAALLLLTGTAVPADAATKTVRDPGTQLSPALNLQRARMAYHRGRIVYRLRIGNLSKAKTQAIVRFYRPGYDLMITTRFVRGKRRVIARRTDNHTYESTRFHQGVSVRWSLRNDVITIVNRRFLSGRAAPMAAYTVPKGAMHGTYTEPNDGVDAVVRRG